ncbi:transposase, partial [Leuconostoc lactis]
MTKISKQIKLQAIQDYLSGKYTIRGITARYGIANSVFHMLIAAYKSFGPDILFNPPAITPEFRIKVASWAIQNNASHSQVAAKFGYTGIAQIVSWKKIY